MSAAPERAPSPKLPIYVTVPQLATLCGISRFALLRRLKEAETTAGAPVLRRRGRCFFVLWGDLVAHVPWVVEGIRDLTALQDRAM